MSGRFEQRGITGNITVAFSFRVIRLWERPVAELLGGGLGVLPLAPLADVEPVQLPGIMRHLDERFRRDASPDEAQYLAAATILMLSMRYTATQIGDLVRNMSWWRNTPAYDVLLELGRMDQVRRDILDLGTEKFGAPDPSVVSALEANSNLEALEGMHRRILRASSWQELLAPEG